MRVAVPALLFTILVPLQSAHAAGYAVREQSTVAMGTAYAGAPAANNDASFLAYNPAAASLAEGGDLSFNVIMIMPSASANYTTALTSAGTATGGNSQPKDFIRNAVIPDIAVRYRVADRWSVGVSVSVPWGLATAYPTGSAGRYYGQSTKLITVNVTPVVAYDITPNITVAGGVQAQYAKGTLSSTIDIGTIGYVYSVPGSIPGAMDGYANMSADSWGYGFVLGARGKFDNGLTAGISYRSAVYHTLSGPLTFTLDSYGVGAALSGAAGLFLDTTAKAKVVTPDKLEFGVRKTINDQLTAMLSVNWTGWSRFKDLTIIPANPYQPNDVTNAQWDDSVMIALGAEYASSSEWTWRGGIAYDFSPAPDSTLETRVPDANRFWIAAGATYHALPSTDLSLSIAHLFNEDRQISLNPTQTGNALRGTLAGTTTSSVDVLGFQVVHRWQ